MSKSTKSLHIEDSLWEEIDKVKDEFNTSRSSALEYILIERRTLLKMLNSIKNIDINSNNKNDKFESNKSTNKDMDNNVLMNFGKNDIMPD